jgi:hypothetical protein
VREKYRAYARTESSNHYEAYPGYRYSSRRLKMKKPYKKTPAQRRSLGRSLAKNAAVIAAGS